MFELEDPYDDEYLEHAHDVILLFEKGKLKMEKIPKEKSDVT